MQRAYRYRLNPNVIQLQKLNNIFRFCRFLYNCALEERISYYKTFGKTLSYSQQCKALSEIKGMFPSETSDIHSQVLQQTLKQLDKAYSNFFKRVKSKS